MFRRLILSIMLLSLFSSAHGAKNQANTQTFVIVHGATGGGWDWKVVAQKLAAKGHTVYRPTLTGLGERSHLVKGSNHAEGSINLTTHISDIVNTILFENLDDVVLVGHSYGGMVITGVANTLPNKIKHLTFLDAGLPDDGMSAFETWGVKKSDYTIKDGLVYFPWLEESEQLPKDVPHPLDSLIEPVAFNNPEAKAIHATFVVFVPEGMSVEQRTNDPSWARAKSRGWTTRTFDGDHVIYREKPNEIAHLLIEAIGDRNK